MVKTIEAARRRYERGMEVAAVLTGGHSPATLDSHRLKHTANGAEANAYERGTAEFLGEPPERVGQSRAAFNFLDAFDSGPKRSGKSDAWIEGMRRGVAK